MQIGLKGFTGTKSVIEALKLLDLFTRDRQQIGLSEFARASGLPKANVLRHLMALEYSGLVKQDPHTKKYLLGFKSLELASLVSMRLRFRDAVFPYMEVLKEKTNETICLQVEENGRGICIERLESSNRLVYLPPLGSREYLHAGASRKVLLAFLPDKRIEEIIKEGLPAITKQTVTNPEHLRREIAQIRAKGYAITEGEHVEGVTAISAPIRDRNGNVIASLSVVGPTFRMDEERKRAYLEHLLGIVRKISEELGYKE